MLVHLVDKIVMVDVADSNNYNIVSKEVCGVEFSQLVYLKLVHVVSISFLGLTNKVISECIIVSVLE